LRFIHERFLSEPSVEGTIMERTESGWALIVDDTGLSGQFGIERDVPEESEPEPHAHANA
jgi:hypothetical protein